jgi:hypothetical protein
MRAPRRVIRLRIPYTYYIGARFICVVMFGFIPALACCRLLPIIIIIIIIIIILLATTQGSACHTR